MERIKSNGGMVTHDPDEIPGGDFSLFAVDSQGASIGLVCPHTAKTARNAYMDKISTHLWCDGNASEAAEFYTGIFPDSSIDEIVHTPSDYPSGKKGDVITVAFTLAGRSFLALNGGPGFPFTEAISLSVNCSDQAEVDRYWEALSAHPDNEQCGWLKDRFGVSWQIIPRALPDLLADPDRDKAKRVMDAMMIMRKIDVAALEAAANRTDNAS